MDKQQVHDLVCATIEKQIGKGISIPHNVPFGELGIDSVTLTAIHTTVNVELKTNIPLTKLYDYPTFEDYIEFMYRSNTKLT